MELEHLFFRKIQIFVVSFSQQAVIFCARNITMQLRLAPYNKDQHSGKHGGIFLSASRYEKYDH